MMRAMHSIHQEMGHGLRYRPTVFTKQVSPPVDGLAPHRGCHAAQVGAISKKDLVSGPIRGLCALHEAETYEGAEDWGRAVLYDAVTDELPDWRLDRLVVWSG
jgi:hypothetical protein